MLPLGLLCFTRRRAKEKEKRFLREQDLSRWFFGFFFFCLFFGPVFFVSALENTTTIHFPPPFPQDYANERVGIDAYCWLHRGAYGCSWELATGAPTDKYVRYCMDRIRCLIHWKVVPVVVFDGGYLPSKAGTEKERRASREARRAQGFQVGLVL